MSKSYTFAKTWGDKVLARGYDNGTPFLEKVPFGPTLFIQSNKQDESTWKSLYEQSPLEPVKFASIKEAKAFVERYKDVEQFPIHGFQRWEYQWINENYPGKIQHDISDINILTLDIEVVSEDPNAGFPDIQLAETPIVLISYHSSKDRKTVVLGTKTYIQRPEDDFEYQQCDDERALLRKFMAFCQTNKPDAWTGWNTSHFDTPYLVNRIIKLFDLNMAKLLSPFGIITEKNIFVKGKSVQTYDIVGVIDLDYLELYKKFTYQNQESYSLGFIAEFELGRTKVDMPGKSFTDNYLNHFDIMVQYSAEDTVLVKDINDKMRLIELAFTMAYTMKCNVQDVYKTVLPWEVYIFNHLVKKNIAYPPKKYNEEGDFEGGYVKEPIKGLHGWTLTFDFSGLYPSIIRQWNISPETFRASEYNVNVNSILEGEEDDVINSFATAKYTNCTMAANGTMYDKSRVGILPELMRECMDNRKAARKMVLDLEQEFERTGDPEVERRISSYNNEQMGAKILANSLFGACGNSGFHFFNRGIAEAITWTGQFSDIHLANTLNAVLNKLLKTEKIDYVLYADTDSTFLNVQPIVDKFCPGKNTDEVTSFLNKFGNTICQDAVQSSVDWIFDMMNCKDKVMASKREVIASKVLFLGKKKYGMYVHDAEGVRYETPKVKVKGLEIVRSSTPKWCREKLKECLKMIFETDELTLRAHFAKLKATFMTLPPSEIAFPRGCSDIDKWSEKGKPKKGTPIAVRAALVYNDTIKSLNNYQKLQNGDKTKFIYLTLPNPIKQNVIGWPSNFELPKEFKLGAFIDYSTQFQKAFENPLTALTDCAGWQLEEKASLTNFFE